MLLLIIMLLLVSCSLAANPAYEIEPYAFGSSCKADQQAGHSPAETHTVWAVDLTTTRLVRGTVVLQTPSRISLAVVALSDVKQDAPLSGSLAPQ